MRFYKDTHAFIKLNKNIITILEFQKIQCNRQYCFFGGHQPIKLEATIDYMNDESFSKKYNETSCKKKRSNLYE